MFSSILNYLLELNLLPFLELLLCLPFPLLGFD
jgi:hypothetical protein